LCAGDARQMRSTRLSLIIQPAWRSSPATLRAVARRKWLHQFGNPQLARNGGLTICK
jgi:hypothetical protein